MNRPAVRDRTLIDFGLVELILNGTLTSADPRNWKKKRKKSSFHK